MSNTIMYNYVVIPGAFLAGGLLIGFILEKLILGRLINFGARTDWPGVQVLRSSFRGLVILWCGLGGLYAATRRVEISTTWTENFYNLLVITVVISATIGLARFGSGVVGIYTRSSTALLPATSIFSNLTRLVVFVVGLLIILQVLGVPVTPLLTALGVGGLAVALALQDTLSNLFAGLQIIGSRQMRTGDYVKLDSGEEGFVRDVTWRNTIIEAPANNTIVVPNSKLASMVYVNYNLPLDEVAVLVQVGVSYSSDLARVESVTREVGREIQQEIDEAITGFEPLIRYHTFGDSSINFTVVLRGRQYMAQHIMKHEFIKRLKERYDKEGITIPFPIRTVHLETGGEGGSPPTP
jgi:small-conductance mechanosensitive channel